jgi:hypothetical protein
MSTSFVVLNIEETGLGNRIKSYVSQMSKYDKILIQKIPDFQCFENFKLATKEDIKKYPHTGSIPREVPSDEYWRLLVDEEEENYLNEHKTIDLLYEKIPSYFIEKYVPVFKKLKLKSNIQKTIDNIIIDWDVDNMVGVCIRSYLNPASDPSRSVWIDFEGFEREIQNLPIDQKFFFCTDNLEIKKYYEEKYYGRIITFCRSVGQIVNDNIDNYTQTKEGLIELYLLSHCKKKIISTFGSTFPECAWWIGGGKAEFVAPTFWDKVPQWFLDNHFKYKN